MSYVRGMHCMECGKEFQVSDVTYQCPKCQGNLDILYDYSAIKKIATREFFAHNQDYSIWRYTPLLPVENCGTIPLQIGWTPLYHIHSDNILPRDHTSDSCQNLKSSHPTKTVQLYIKDDGRNPSASFKDRASSVALLHAKSIGAKKITGASTGNAGSSMACLCASVGMPLVIFVPEKAPQAKIAQLLIFGSQVIMVKGTYDTAFNLCLEVSKQFGWYNRNTGYNPYTREGKKTCAYEICEQLNWHAPDWVLVSVGDGNILSGLWKGFCDLHQIGLIEKLPKLGAIQSAQSSAIYQAVTAYHQTKKISIPTIQATTIADSISVDLPRDGFCAVKAILDSQGMAITVEDQEILSAISISAKQWGIFAEPAGATSIAGFWKMQQLGIFKQDETVVSVVTGSGLKDVSSAMKAAGKPILIEPNLEAVQKIFLA